jgi:hypothetical protein
MSSSSTQQQQEKLGDVLTQLNQLLTLSKAVEEQDTTQAILNKLVENAEQKLERQKKLLASLKLLAF